MSRHADDAANTDAPRDSDAQPPRALIPSADAWQELGRLRALIAHSSDPLDLLDRDGRILYASPSRERPLGHEDGYVGKSAFELIHPDDRPGILALFAELRDASCGSWRRAEFRARHRDGSWRWVVSTATNLFDDPDVGAIVMSLRDVTEQKTAEAELQMSQRLASIGILAAGIGHEINNPLSCVLSALQVAERTLLGLQQEAPSEAGSASDNTPARLAHLHEGLLLARDGAQRIAGVIGGLRAWSRPDVPESGRAVVARAVESALSVVRASFSGRVRFAPAGESVADVLADEARLGQVLLNLLTNAAQAIPEGRRDPCVEVTTRSLAGGRVAIEVRDNGEGIAADHLPHIFDPFFTTKGRDQGSGLGLSISRRIVVSFGGSIDVESVVGEGSMFRVALPVAPDASGEASPSASSPPARPKLLLIDDEAQLVVALTAILEDGFEVRAATSARDALAAIRAGARYDVVLCDLMMRDLGGAEFHAQLAELAPSLPPRVVFMTGGAFTPDARAFLERTDNPCLSKPLDVDLLRRTLLERATG